MDFHTTAHHAPPKRDRILRYMDMMKRKRGMRKLVGPVVDRKLQELAAQRALEVRASSDTPIIQPIRPPVIFSNDEKAPSNPC